MSQDILDPGQNPPGSVRGNIMNQVTETPVVLFPLPPVDLAGTREKYIGSIATEYGAGRDYARALIQILGTAWITMPHDQKGPEGDAMRAERDTLYKGLREAGHKNPSVKWKQVKDHADSILADIARAESGESEGEGEGESEGKGGAKHTRTTQLMLVEELTALFKRCKKDESKRLLNAQQQECFTHITSALRSLGVETSML